MATLDLDTLHAIRDEEVRRDDRALVDFKYFHIRPWIFENLKRAMRLGIDQVRYRRILDIGTGFGYFPYVCEFLEHTPSAIDIPGHRLYDRVIDALRIRRTVGRVEAFTPLPGPDQRYDYVTAYQIAFNHPNEGGTWGAAEWQFFLEDILTNHLRPGGRIHLEVNWSYKNGQWYDEPTAKMLDRLGAIRRGNEIDIVGA